MKTVKPCTRKKDDEAFQFLAFQWNVSEILKYLEQNPREPQQVSAKSLAQYHGLIGIDKEYALKTTSEEPGILVEMFDGGSLLVDGWHRSYRDMQVGKPTFPVYVLTFVEQLSFLTQASMIQTMQNFRKKYEVKLKEAAV